MSNKSIINKLKEQVKDLEDNIYSDDDKLRDWVVETKIYILGLWLDKKDDGFKKEIINMLERYKDRIPTYTITILDDPIEEPKNIAKEILRIQGKLINVLKSFIKVLELREKDLKNEEKQEAKKTTTKKKSD